MSKSNNSNQSKSSAKTVIKNVLGQVPFTAEIYWLVRHRDKKINSRFSLKRLEENLSNLCDQALNFSGEKAQQPKSIFVFATLHYWIEHAAVTGISLAAIGHEVTLGFLPYHDWQNEINKFDLRRQNLYAKDVLKKAVSVLASVSLLDLHAGYKMLPDDLQERIEIITRYDTMYTLQVEDVTSEGAVNVRYFNPGEIHVAQSQVGAQEGRIKLFVKLQDKGYPGSTYTLYYYAEKDVLAGIYYQAVTGNNYDVIFVRKKAM